MTLPVLSDDAAWPYVECFRDGVEVPQPAHCDVSGSIPAWLTGRLYRTGPGIFDIESPKGPVSFRHWFDGIGITHLFSIQKGGNVTYRNAITAKSRLDSIKENGIAAMTFGPVSDPCQRLYKKYFSTFQHVEQQAGFAVTIDPTFVVPGSDAPICTIRTDSNLIQVVDVDTLKPVENYGTTYGVLHPELAKGVVSPAHPEFDPVTSSLMNVVVVPGQSPEYIVFESQQDLKQASTKILAKFNDPHVAYQHSFSSTQRYVIVQLWPMSYGWKGMKIATSSCFTDAMEWDAERAARFVVIDRIEQQVVAEYSGPAEYCFHTINAFEDEDGDIVMDFLMCKSGEAIHAFEVPLLRNGAADIQEVKKMRDLIYAKFTRMKLKGLEGVKARYAARGGVGAAVADDAPPAEVVLENPLSMELPSINPSWRYKQEYRFVYSVSTLKSDMHSHLLFDSLVKLDIKTQTHLSWWKVGHSPSEPIFVANPDSNGQEDDGVILSVVLDGTLAKSYLLVLDARTMKEVATADVGQAIPYGLHGSFV
ncbi:hypothetical protein HDU81_007005 [Chytriomyces hyalinus]|nr:hypothetical protein HDU81_007005 [Chytriomyces hyalinus]